MPIPKDVLAVDRPKNSIVIAYGKNRDRYAVRARVGCRSDGQRRLPVNGPTHRPHRRRGHGADMLQGLPPVRREAALP